MGDCIVTATLVTTAVSLYYIYAVLRIGKVTEEYAATIHVGPDRTTAANNSELITIALGWRQPLGRKPVCHYNLCLQARKQHFLDRRYAGGTVQ